jgi:hypothetical protein
MSRSAHAHSRETAGRLGTAAPSPDPRGPQDRPVRLDHPPVRAEHTHLVGWERFTLWLGVGAVYRAWDRSDERIRARHD